MVIHHCGLARSNPNMLIQGGATAKQLFAGLPVHLPRPAAGHAHSRVPEAAVDGIVPTLVLQANPVVWNMVRWLHFIIFFLGGVCGDRCANISSCSLPNLIIIWLFDSDPDGDVTLFSLWGT